MADVDGSWDCTVKSPLGDQTMTLKITADGDTFFGSASGGLGSMDVGGTLDGNRLAWKQSISVPMPMTLDCSATVDGDVMTGSVGAGAFGSFPLTGKRAA